MQVKIQPSIARGIAQAPPSKSMAHRYLIAAALSNGKSVISDVEYSQDILATIDCLRALGVRRESNNFGRYRQIKAPRSIGLSRKR